MVTDRSPDPVRDPRWGALYRFAGVGALASAAAIPLQVMVFVAWPPPEPDDVEGWLDLFHDNPLLGLVSFDLVLLVEQALLGPIVLALYVLLHQRSESLMLVATAAWLVSVALFIGSNTAFDMLALGQAFPDAGEAERQAILGAARGFVASYMAFGTSFVVGYVLASLAGIGVGVAMLRAQVFHSAAGWAAIVGNAAGFGLFIPVVGIPISILAVVVLLAWYALIGWRLLHLPATRG